MGCAGVVSNNKVIATYRAATSDITSVMKSLPWGKNSKGFLLKEHFRPCISVKALVIAKRVAGGRKEGTTKDIKVLQVECGLNLASYCR